MTDVGLVRSSNQDAFALLDDLGLWIVADGMGGHPGGDVASRVAVETITAFMQPGGHATRTLPPQPGDERLRQAIIASNEAVRRKATADPRLAGMGTTVVALQITGGPAPRALVAHVGDSRAYLLRDGTLTPLTRDHSAVEESLRQGRLTPEQAAVHPDRHVLTRALGTEPVVAPDLSAHLLRPHDVVLLCTDGLTKMLSDRHIASAMLALNGGNPETICRRLIDEANGRGGDDNTTVVVVQCVFRRR